MSSGSSSLNPSDDVSSRPPSSLSASGHTYRPRVRSIVPTHGPEGERDDVSTRPPSSLSASGHTYRPRVRSIVPTPGPEGERDDVSTRPSSSLSASGHTYRPRVRSIVPTPGPEDGSRDASQYSSSNSDDESDGGSINQSGEPSHGSESGDFDRRDPRHRSIRLGQQTETERRAPTVQPTRRPEYASIRLRQRPTRIPWEPPFKNKEVKQRAKKVLKGALQIKTEEKKSLFDCCKRPCARRETEDEEELQEVEELPVTELSPEMQKANSEGYNLMKQIFFPSIPAVLQDIWVYLELLISIAAFVIGLLGLFPIKEDVGFQYFYLILATIAMVMALLDGFIYFFQLGSCARGFRFIRKALKERKKRESGEEDEDEEEEEAPKKSCGMSPELQAKFNTWFELVRNLLNEFLLYPLLVCDLFDFISEGLEEGFLPDSTDGVGNTDFSFFVIGGLYLILAVYIMRVFMVFGTMLSLLRLPHNKNASGADKGITLLIKFCIHVIGQIIVHFVILLVLAAKIHNENNIDSNPGNGSMLNMSHNLTANMSMEVEEEGGGIRASPFLIVSLVMGGILPLAGVAVFFIVNYYWMREFSIGFWLNMLSLLQGPSFAETVFGGDGLTPAKDQANEFLDNSGFDTVKSQLGRYKSAAWWTKFLYPARVPVVALCGVLYDVCLLLFTASLMLTYEDGVVRIVVFQGDDTLSVTFVIALVTIFIANLHVLLLLNFLLLVLTVIGILICMSSVAAIPVVVFVYLPSVALLGYVFLFRDIAGKCCPKKRKTKVHCSDDVLENKSFDASYKEMKEYNGTQNNQGIHSPNGKAVHELETDFPETESEDSKISIDAKANNSFRTSDHVIIVNPEAAESYA